MMAILEGTKSKALRVAQDLLQARGFNGFSFQHIADELGEFEPRADHGHDRIAAVPASIAELPKVE